MNRPGDWNCMSCQNLNFQRRDSCHRCGEPRYGCIDRGGVDFSFLNGVSGMRGASLSSSFGITGPDVRPGDWYCNIGNCGTHNFASRSSCFKCGAFKDELGGGGGGGFDCGADNSRGRGFGIGGGSGSAGRSAWKSGDWICNRLGCNEHNFASRMECFRCNAPREPAGSKSYSYYP
ncbi:TATA-binding protein-associated factor 2N-like [Heracleum sosnowskyi]|uniref:TATA-binding protein-associated factor 2N-like n=1 Tax=Heracleum sosnowskyi TaxID=360622 RepID=A0AAD8HZD3_9APIA|nr:TATA-binding protein-associated factor 2N-like [Heracleum sosnowskyi]